MSTQTAAARPTSARALVGVTAILVVLTAASLGVLAVRIDRVGDPAFSFLVWNLFLAWVPYLIALVVAVAHAARLPGLVLAGLGVVWLLFLPNAPYILTDFIHLGALAGAPLWFDALLIGAFAGTGLLLGMGSLLMVHRVVEDRRGPVAGWLLALASLALSSLGIYLGRFPRFNSWDVLTDPLGLLGVIGARLADPLGNPFLWQFAGTMTLILLAAYAVTWSVGRGYVART